MHKPISYRRYVVMAVSLLLCAWLTGGAAPAAQFLLQWGGPQELAFPFGLAVCQDRVYVADTDNHRIVVYRYREPRPQFLTAWGRRGSAEGQFVEPWAIAADAKCEHIYVADRGNHRVQHFDGDGNYLGKWGQNGQLKFPEGIALDAQDNVYVADTGHHRIQKFTADGTFVAKWGSEGTTEGEFSSPTKLSVDAQGQVFVADKDNNRVQKCTGQGQCQTVIEAVPAPSGPTRLAKPESVAVTRQGEVLVADTLDQRIVMFDTQGHFMMQWGSEGNGAQQFQFPRDIAVDAQGRIFVLDTGNNRIQVYVLKQTEEEKP